MSNESPNLLFASMPNSVLSATSPPFFIRHINEWIYIGTISTTQITEALQVSNANYVARNYTYNAEPQIEMTIENLGQINTFLDARIGTVISMLNRRNIMHGWLTSVTHDPESMFPSLHRVRIVVQSGVNMPVAPETTQQSKLADFMHRVEGVKKLVRTFKWYHDDFEQMIADCQSVNQSEFNYLGVTFDIQQAVEVIHSCSY